MDIQRLGPNQRETARTAFRVMAEIFGETAGELSDSYIDQLLARPDFWVLAALDKGRAIGGLTAHTLPMTRAESAEVFLYDLAVLPEYQRQGIGRRLIAELLEQAAEAGIGVMFVPADNEDTHALDFYRAIGGEGAEVTIFTFGA